MPSKGAILVIDDDHEMRRTMCKMLERSGYDAIAAKSGADGLELFRTVKPDLVITDIYMPDMDGIEIVREIHAINPRARLVAVSGGGSLGNIDFLKSATLLGAIATLTKPFRSKELIETIERALAT